MPNNAYHHNVVPQPSQGQNQILTQKRNPERSFVNFTPILMFYTELLPTLLHNSLVTVSPMKPVQPLYPKNYDANAKCDYHDGEIGLSTERCFALKHKVQALIDAGWISFKEDKPNVEANPLAGHASSSTNAIIEDERYDMVRGVNMIQTPMKKIYIVLCQAGYLKVENKQGNECGLHLGISHSIDECSKFKQILQDLIDRHILQIYRQEKEGEVCTQTGEETTLSGPKPVVIRFTKALHLSQEQRPIVIQAPSPFLYKNEKAVPWKYDAQVLKGAEERKEANQTPTIVNTAIDNISGIGGMTRSSRVFTPAELRNEENQGKRTREEIATEQARAFLKGKAPQTEQDAEKSGKKEISDKEAGEFLKFIQQSEYKVVDQLNRMPARISLLELLTHSVTHRKLLMKILSGAHVEHDLSLDKFEGIISHIKANDYLTFTEEEIPVEGRGHNKALHISVKCMDYVLARVLIDNGSYLIVIPKATLDKLPRERSHMLPRSMIVRAFDGSKREVIGEIELPIQVGPCTFEVVFQVMDIIPAYSCLLGQPWIHSAGVVPSTLHQKLNFVVDNKLIIVSDEEDFLVSEPTTS